MCTHSDLSNLDLVIVTLSLFSFPSHCQDSPRSGICFNGGDDDDDDGDHSNY